MDSKKNSRAEQARINGAKSKGAKTPQGLERCRTAAVKHGYYAAQGTIIPGEDPAQHQAMWHALIDQYHPRNIAELAMVAELLDNIWGARRMTIAANTEVQRQMAALAADSSMEGQSAAELHVRAQTESKVVERFEARARHFHREVARIQKILKEMQTHTVSVESSQMSTEILDETIEMIENSYPETPEKRPPHHQTPPENGRNNLRR